MLPRRLLRARLTLTGTTSRSASAIASGLYKTAYTALKIATVPPIPSASVTSATAVKPGLRLSIRSAYRTSCHQVVSSERLGGDPSVGSDGGGAIVVLNSSRMRRV